MYIRTCLFWNPQKTRNMCNYYSRPVGAAGGERQDVCWRRLAVCRHGRVGDRRPRRGRPRGPAAPDSHRGRVSAADRGAGHGRRRAERAAAEARTDESRRRGVAAESQVRCAVSSCTCRSEITSVNISIYITSFINGYVSIRHTFIRLYLSEYQYLYNIIY